LAETITIIEVRESERVCQASAINAIDPVIIPTQIFKTNKAALTTTDKTPSIICAFFLSITISPFAFLLTFLLPAAKKQLGSHHSTIFCLVQTKNIFF
jgi:hypothetical protein